MKKENHKMGKFINPFTQDSVFQRLASIEEVAALSKEDRMKYDKGLRKFRDTISVMEGQRMEGRMEGKAEGRMEVAAKLKAMGFDIRDIEEATGLSPQEIDSL